MTKSLVSLVIKLAVLVLIAWVAIILVPAFKDIIAVIALVIGGIVALLYFTGEPAA